MAAAARKPRNLNVASAEPLETSADVPGERFVEDLAREFERAAAASRPCELTLEVGDVGVELRFADATLARLVERAMGHLRSVSGRSALRIDFFAGGTLPESPWPFEAPRAKGEIGPDAPAARFRACLQPELPALHCYDRSARRGWVWYRDPERLPSWEHPHLPLRILHFALADFGWFTVHGAVVERDGGGILMPGRSGAGKTTTALAALAGGYGFLGDDHVLVRTALEPEAAALFATARLTPESERLLAPLGLRAPVAAPATPPSDKSLFYVGDFPGARLARRARLEAIALPRRAPVDRAPERASPAEALRDLAPSTVLFLPHAGAIGTFERLAGLVRSVPAYRVPLGPELSEVGGCLDRLRELARADGRR